MTRTTLTSTKRGLALIGGTLATAALALAVAGAPAVQQASADTGDAQAGTVVVQQAQRSINVSASDSVKVAPDMVELTLTIAPQANTAQEAKDRAATELAELTGQLKALGIDEANIVSTQVSISARYDWSESVEKVVGYQASVSITAKELTLDQAGGSISAAAAVADTTVEGVRYYVSTYDEIYQQALVSAMDAAKTKAGTLALASDAELGEVLNVQEGYDAQAYRYAKAQSSQNAGYGVETMAAEDASAAGATDIALNPGLVEIEASVTVTYALK